MCAPLNTFLVLFFVIGHSAMAVKFLAASDGLCHMICIFEDNKRGLDWMLGNILSVTE